MKSTDDAMMREKYGKKVAEGLSALERCPWAVMPRKKGQRKELVEIGRFDAEGKFTGLGVRIENHRTKGDMTEVWVYEIDTLGRDCTPWPFGHVEVPSATRAEDVARQISETLLLHHRAQHGEPAQADGAALRLSACRLAGQLYRLRQSPVIQPFLISQAERSLSGVTEERRALRLVSRV